MADSNNNHRLSRKETEMLIEQLKQPQDWSQARVQRCFDELGFDFPETEEQMRQWNEKFKDFPFKADPTKIDPIKILERANASSPKE